MTPRECREQAEQRILDGPDCPAKTFLLARLAIRAKQKEPARAIIAAPRGNLGAAMVQRIRKLPKPTGHPLRAGPDFFQREDAEQKLVENREPGAEG